MAMNSRVSYDMHKADYTSPRSDKRQNPKRQLENKENKRFKILQKAANIAKSRKCIEDKDFLLKVIKGTKEQPKTPNQNSLTQIELMEMFSKESEKIFKHKEEMYDELFKTNSKIFKKRAESRGNQTAKQPQSYKSPIREINEEKESIINIDTANYLSAKYEQLKDIDIPDMISTEVAPTKSKSKLIKFNDKVRKANMKLMKRKKSKHRSNSKNKIEEVQKPNSRNSSLHQLKERINKRIIKSHFNNENHNYESDHEEKYNPLDRQIGLDFLQFIKKKKNMSKMFLSTQKSGFEWGEGNRIDNPK